MTIVFDKDSGVPIYRQLLNIIKQQILEGEYQIGDMLPGETELMHRYNISRTTVRLTFNELVKDGLVKRERGKGTIVTSTGIKSKLSSLSSFTEEVARLDMVPGTKLLSVETLSCPGKVAKKLEIEPDSSIIKAVRLRTADDRPIGLASTWFNIVAVPALAQIDFKHLSLYEVYEQELNLAILRAVEHVWADMAKEDEEKKLGINHGESVLRMTRVTYIESQQDGGTPIEFVEAVFRGKVYIMETELFRKQ